MTGERKERKYKWRPFPREFLLQRMIEFSCPREWSERLLRAEFIKGGYGSVSVPCDQILVSTLSADQPRRWWVPIALLQEIPQNT